MASEQELLVQFKQGDANAFRALVEQYTPPIYNLALRLLRDSMEAENLTQDTFLRVLNARERIRADLPFKPYVFRIAVNACRDRARKHQPVLFTDLARAEEMPDDELFSDHSAPLEDSLAEQELHTRLFNAVETLPHHYQVVITLRYTEELSYEEIAATLDLPLNTVRTHLRRAKKLLRAKLGARD